MIRSQFSFLACTAIVAGLQIGLLVDVSQASEPYEPFGPRSKFEKAYKQHFETRFGTPERRPPKDVLEQRCMQEIEHLISVIPANAMFKNHYVKVAEVWKSCATDKSLPLLERALPVCRDGSWLRSGGNISLPYDQIWLRLSQIWFDLIWKKQTKEQFASTYINALTEKGKNKPSAYVMGDWLDKLDPSAKDAFYQTLFEEQLREDVLMLIPQILGHKEFRPTKQQLLHILKKDDHIVDFAVKNHFAVYRTTDKQGLEILLKDLESNDYSVLHQFIKYVKHYFHSKELGMAEKDKLFNVLHQRLLGLERANRQGRYMEWDDPRPYKPNRLILGLLTWVLVHFSGDAHPAITDFSKRHIKELTYHVDWLEHESKRIYGKEYPESSYAKTVQRWRARLTKWR